MKIINKYNAIKKALRLTLFILTLAVGISFLTNNVAEDVEVDSATTDIVKVYVEAVNAYKGEAYPVVSNGVCAKTVSVNIKLSKASTNSITVHYRTFDSTASCTSKTKEYQIDYEPTYNTETTLTFNPKETSRTVTINVYAEKFPVYYQSKDKNGGWTGRYFYFQLTEVEGKDAELDKSRSEVKCHIAYDYIYQGENKNNTKCLTILRGDYCNTTVSTKETFLQDVTSLGNNEYAMCKVTAFTNDQIKYAVETGLAYGYVNMAGKVFDTSVRQEDVFVGLRIENTTVADAHLDGYLGAMTWIPWIFAYKFYGDDWDYVDFGYAGDKNVVRSYSNQNDCEGSNNYYSGKYTDDFIKAPKCVNYGSHGNLYLMGKNDRYVSFVIGSTVQAHGRGTRSIVLRSALLDTMKPYITSYWCDKVLNLNSNKVQMMVRFNQPVTLTSTTNIPVLTCAATTSAGESTLDFTYAAGDGSDTFVFEADLTTCGLNSIITKLTPAKIKNAQYIVDASGQRNALGQKSSITNNIDFEDSIPAGQQLSDISTDLNNCSNLLLDPRKPKIQTEVAEETKIKNEFTVTVSTENFDSKTGKFYYCWSNDCTNTTTITREGEYTEIGYVNEGTYTIQNDSLTGVRFLWVKAVSKLGLIDAKILGPYKFDNVAETASNLTYNTLTKDGETHIYTEKMAMGPIPSMYKYITFEIDHTNDFYTSSNIAEFDLVWATDEVWNEKTEIHYNNNDDISSKHLWIQGQFPANYEFVMVKDYPITQTKPDWKFGIISAIDNGKEETSHSVTAFQDGSSEYTIKCKYACEVIYDEVGIKDGETRQFYLGVRLCDSLGNTKSGCNYDYIKTLCYMDSRNIKPGTWTFDNNASQALKNINELVYTTDSGFSFTSTNAINPGIPISIFIKQGNNEVEEFVLNEAGTKFLKNGNESDKFTITYDGAQKFTFVPKTSNTNLAGYYTIYILFKEKQDKIDWSYSNNFEFYYVTQDKSSVLTFTDNTYNLSGMKNLNTLTNKVYTINLNARYYYKDAGNTTQFEMYSTGSPLSFSSETKCKEYLKFMEYQDFTLVVLTTGTASNLNNGSSGMVKASGQEDYVAQEGQTWIKYKRKTWSYETTSDSNWVYYLYSFETKSEINLTEVDTSLKEAVSLVADKIMESWGGYEYLNSDFGLSKYGAPQLSEDAIKDKSITVTNTRSGSKFMNGCTYDADSAIYKNDVKYNDVYYKLASTYELVFNSKSIIYYAKYEGKDVAWSDYTKVQSNGELLLRKLISNQGAYRFIELDENGAQSYTVYIDTSAPLLKFEYEQKDENGDLITKTQWCDSAQSAYSFYGVKCVVGAIDDQEIDEYSYVTIYNAKTNFVYAEYTRDELKEKEGKIVLENGKYNVEVYDRSGNNYIVSIALNDTELSCTITEKKNQYIMFTVNNRVKADIDTYTVYFNAGNLPVANSFEETRTFSEAGTYTFEVKDFYGNSYHAVYEFKREIPELNWIYHDENGKWVNYDPTKIQDMYVETIGSQVFNVITSKEIGFDYDGTFEMLVTNNKDSSIVYTPISMGLSGTYKFTETSDFSFTVSYVKYPEVYAVYNIYFDTKGPDINPTYTEYSIQNLEENNIGLQVSNTIGIKLGDVIVPETVAYLVTSSYDKKIPINGKCCARSIKIGISDDTEVYQITISLNGEILVQTTEVEDTYEFEKYGEYLVTAVDRLNNKSIYRFKNVNQSDYEYSVDDVKCVTPVTNFEYFDDNFEYTKVEYGNTNGIFNVPNDGTVSILIKNGEEKLYFRYGYDGTSLVKKNYVAIYCYDDKQLDASGNVIAEYVLGYEDVVDKEVFNLSMVTGEKVDGTLNGTVKYKEWYKIATVETDGVDIYVMVDENNILHFKVDASNFEEDCFDTQIKITPSDNGEPFFARLGLSKKKSDVILENEDGLIETNHTGESLFVNGSIKIDREDANTQEITSIKAAYSVDGKFKDEDFVAVYENGEFKPYVLEYEGFYKIIIDNIYGNRTIYNIALSNNCLVVLEMIYYDSTSNTYTSTYEYDNFYSNDIAKIDVYSQGIAYDVTKDGVQITPNVLKEETHIGITLQGDGSYVVRIQDQFGNHFTKYIDIELKTLTISDELLTGFNEKALLRSDNYTNRKISVNYDELQMTQFDYIYVFKDNKVNNAIYDMLAENKIEFDESKLVDCIGNDGDGIYKVVFRDKFGNAATADINYSETTTMDIERQSRTELNPIKYDLEKALTDGAYSNNIVTILSNSSCYTFIVNGNHSKLPYTFEFANNTITEGQRDFEVYYLDEYGFEYSFKIHLLRTTINFDDVKFDVVTINEKQYTQDHLFLTFDDKYTCNYVLDNAETSVNYPSGFLVNDDGSYLFTLSDVAGNVCYYQIIKDTIVEYAFIGNNTETEYVSSSVVGSETVCFTVKNKDTAKIEKVFLDGEELTEYDTKQIKADGKWEFLLTDEVGNKAVYTIYIITHSMNHFDYTCPKNYQVVDVRYDSGNGQNLDYMNQVVDYSSFSFNEDGKYKVTIQSTITGETTKFEFEISNTPPQAILDGVVDGESTISNVTLKGTVKGDVIYIYKDGKLTQTFEVSEDGQTPEIEEKGEYRFVIENLAGNITELTFTKKYVANTAGSVLIIVVVVALGISLFIGVVYRNKAKVDK